MKYIEKKDNIEKIYDVSYDEEKLKKLLDEIIKNTSIRKEGEFTAPYESKHEGNKFTSGAFLANGDPMFEDIELIYDYTSKGPYSYHGDSTAVKGKRVLPPNLANIIESILNNREYGFNNLLEYGDSPEIIPIDDRIENANNAVNELDNFDYDNKIEALNNLKYLCEAKKSGEYYNAELLKEYYNQALSLFELQLVAERIVDGGEKILLKDKLSKK